MIEIGSNPETRGSCCIGEREFNWGERTYVMGIINVTPDSFSGDGVLQDSDPEKGGVETAAVSQAVRQAERFAQQGADILDVGGESTRPGATPVDAAEEIDRVVPVIDALRQVTSLPISVDTYKATVARAALDAGANMVNDVWALRMDPDMAPLIAERNVPIVLMHNQSRPKDARQHERLGGRYVGVDYDDLLTDVLQELKERISVAIEAGISRNRIIIDPGIGFGKTVSQNLQLINRIGELRVLGVPILLGPSRKSFIGYTLDLPPDDRVEGTAATIAVGMCRGGVDIARVHDVRAVTRVVRMTDAILRS
jgi:dihydropteroate synthase